MNNERIKLRILIPLTIAIVCLLGAFISGAFRLLNNDLDEGINHYLTSVKRVIKNRHHSDVETMSTSLERLAENQTLYKAFLQKDRGKLAQVLGPYFEELKHNHHTTHFSIHDTDGVNFVRLHDPQRFGDKIERFTFKKAVETGALFFGMELNPDGLFVLRTVTPWKIDGKLIGYLEIGKELKYMTQNVPLELGVNVIAFVNKKFVLRERWEDKHRQVDSSDCWDDYENFVIIDKSISVDPASVSDFLATDHQDHEKAHMRFEQDGAYYLTSVFQLIDARNRDVGDIMVFYDVTRQVTRAHRLLILISFICVLVGSALIVSFYKMLGSLEQELSDSREQLLEESRNRLEIEQKHARELAKHVIEVEVARTKALNAAKEAERAQLELQQKMANGYPSPNRK